MKERPILFCGEMVRAVLDGRKTMTRRVVNLDVAGDLENGIPTEGQMVCDQDGDYWPALDWCPYGKPGDRLWVRETWMECQECGAVNFRATVNRPRNCTACDASLEGPWKPSIFMRRDASRILLEVTEVRVERVQEITEEDAKLEGCPTFSTLVMPQLWFEELWDSINQKRGFGWDRNPWVWVVGFKRIQPC